MDKMAEPDLMVETGANIEAEQIFRSKRVVMLGVPGAGKSTLIDLVGEVNEVSLGKITRGVDPESDLGIEIRSLFATGGVWPDQFLIDLIRPTLSQYVDAGFLIDGIPRKDSEVDALIRLISELDTSIDLILNLKCESVVALERIKMRKEQEGDRLSGGAEYLRRISLYEAGSNDWIDRLMSVFNAEYLEVDTTLDPTDMVKRNLLNSLVRIHE